MAIVYDDITYIEKNKRTKKSRINIGLRSGKEIFVLPPIRPTDNNSAIYCKDDSHNILINLDDVEYIRYSHKKSR